MQLNIDLEKSFIDDLSKNQILHNLETSVEEMQLIKERKIEALNARDLLDAL